MSENKETYESVVQQRDALAAENEAMKENIENVISHWAAAEPGDMSWMMDKCIPSLRDSCIETPVTDEFTRELMAKSVEDAAKHMLSMGSSFGTAFDFLMSHASQLRKGINDAQ